MDKRQLLKRAKVLQKAFDDEDFILRLLRGNNQIENRENALSYVFEYFLCTMDKKHNYTLDEIFDKLTGLKYGGNPVIDQRYYFQAYNGACEETYRKNGLDDISGLDSRIIEAMHLLESELGETPMVKASSNENYQVSFVTSSPEMLMRYALNFSPERLWYGPLNESGEKNCNGKPLKTPMRIGEKKTDYIMRIIEKKIEGMSEERKEKIREAGRIIAEAYGGKRPRIAIIPEGEIGSYKASFGLAKDRIVADTVTDLAERENPYWIYNLENGPNFAYEGGVILYEKVTPDKFVSISIPDAYELLQMYAIQRGANFGDLIDPYSGKIVERAKEKSMMPAKRTKNFLSQIIDKIKNRGQKAQSPVQNQIYEDFRLD